MTFDYGPTHPLSRLASVKLTWALSALTKPTHRKSKDPEVYDRFEKIVLVHGCRQVSELAYGERLVRNLETDELFGPILKDKLIYYPTVTREPFRNRGRITDLITSERLFNDVDLKPLDIETDRLMLCGSPSMLEDLRRIFKERGFAEGNHSEPGHFVIEKAFVER